MKKPSSIIRVIVILAVAFASVLRISATMSQSWVMTFDGSTLPNDAFVGSPALGSDGTLYIAGAFPDPVNNQRRLYAINGSTGALLTGWPVLLGVRINPGSALAQDKGIESSPAIGPDGMIYIGSWNYGVYKINPSTRVVTSWSPTGTQPKGVLRAAPLIKNGYLYCWMDGDPLVDPSFQQPHLVILNASTMGFVASWTPDAGFLGDAIASPALGRNNILYAASHHINGSDRLGRVYAIDVTLPLAADPWLWSYPTDYIGGIVASPIIDADGKVYVCTQQGSLNGVPVDGSIICFNPKLAAPWTPVWSRNVGSSRPIDGTPAVGNDGTIYVPIDEGNGSSSFAPFNAQIQVDTGTISFDWGFNLSGTEKFDSSPVVAADGSIFTKSMDASSTAAKLYHLSAVNGAQLDTAATLGNDSIAWHTDSNLGGGITAPFSSPVIGPDGKVYVATAGNQSGVGPFTPLGSGRVICFTTGLSGYSFWPGFRGNNRNTGNVQDNSWTEYTTPNATITTLYSYPVSGHGQALAVNTSGKAIGFVPHYPNNGKYAACNWSVGVSQFPSSMAGLGTFGSSFNYVANGLNDANAAVGSQTVDSSGTLRAIYWSSLGATPTELTRPSGYTQGEAIEISRSGMVVGNTKNSSALWRATRWDTSASVGVDLGVLGVGSGLQSYGYGIRARIVGNTTVAANGSIVGKSQSASGGVYHAFSTPWNRGISATSDNLSGSDQSEAHAVNGLGQIVGGSANGATAEHAWIWLINADGTIAKLDLGTLGGATSRALAINNRGQVVGWSYKSNGLLAAFVWVPGWTAIKELQTLLNQTDSANWTYLSVAYGISDDGTVVGYGYQTGSTNNTAFAMKPY